MLLSFDKVGGSPHLQNLFEGFHMAVEDCFRRDYAAWVTSIRGRRDVDPIRPFLNVWIEQYQRPIDCRSFLFVDLII